MTDGPLLRLEWDGDDALETRVYSGLTLSSPVAIRLCACDPAAAAQQAQLAEALARELTLALGAREAPGAGFAETPQLHSALVLVLSGEQACGADAAALADRWSRLGEKHATLPLMPLSARGAAASLTPPSARQANALFWAGQPTEAIAAILLCAGVTTAPRIFISYRQIDSAALAMQLFDALSHAGFDVFLDHFRIPPGVNFQARLTQELGDKSMLLLLESEHLPQSPWVTYEINVAKACGLGLMALSLPHGPARGSIDRDLRARIEETDFVSGAFSAAAQLTSMKLDEIVARVQLEHDRALVNRRKMLASSFESALALERLPPPIHMADGAIHIKGGRKNYLVWLTARPPELPDFHAAHSAAVVPTVGVVIGLSRLMEPPRAADTAWLAGLSKIRGVDEGQLAAAAHAIAEETL